MAETIQLYKDLIKDTFRAPNAEIQTDKPRIQFIDLAKGVCILLVCIEHTELRGIMPHIFSLLRMPLYFVLAGLFFKDYGNFFNLTEKKINKILIPALFFYSISYPLYKVCEHFGLLTDKGGHFFSVFLSDIRYCLPVWFLFALFFSNIIFCIIYRLAKERTFWVFIGSLLCSCAGYALYATQTRLVMYIDTTLSMMPFFFFGWWLRKVNILLPSAKDKLWFWLSIVAIAALVIGESRLGNYRIDYIYNELPGPHVIVSMLVGGILVLSTLFFLKSIVWLPFISYIGRYSIIVLLIHSQFIAALRSIFTSEREWLVLLCTILICWLSIPIMRRYMPHVCAQKDWFKLPFRKKGNNL